MLPCCTLATAAVFTSKEEIARAVKDELAKSMTGFGFAIIQTLITDIEPAIKVKDAMNEINAGQPPWP